MKKKVFREKHCAKKEESIVEPKIEIQVEEMLEIKPKKKGRKKKND